MAYYLGIKNGSMWKPLKIVDASGSKVKDEILDLIHFTLTFDDEDNLKRYLLDTQAISNENIEFGYIISKGDVKNRDYERIYFGDTLYFKKSASYFLLDQIMKKVKKQKYDINFIDELYAFYLKKHDYLNSIIVSLEYRRKYENIDAFFQDLLTKPLSDDVKKILQRLKNNLVNGNSYDYYLELLKEKLSESSKDFILFVHLIHPSRYKIPVLRYLKEIHLLVHQIEDECLFYMEDFSKVEDSYEQLIKNFLDTVLYQYDRKGKEYRIENGEYKVQERNLCDLGMFLYHYDKKLYQKCFEVTSEESSYYLANDEDQKLLGS